MENTMKQICELNMRCGIQIQKVYRYKQRKAFPKCQNRQFSVRKTGGFGPGCGT